MQQRVEWVTHLTQVASSESVCVLIEIGLGQVEDRPEYGFTPIGKNVCLLESCSIAVFSVRPSARSDDMTACCFA